VRAMLSLAVALAAACSSSTAGGARGGGSQAPNSRRQTPGTGRSGPTASGPPSPSGLDLAASQGCLGSAPETGTGRIAWSQLRNPILSYPTSGIRDPSIRLVQGQWHLFFTAVTGNAPDWSLVTSTSADLYSWSAPVAWTQSGVLGLASPDVTRRPDGTYVAVYQSDPGETTPPGQDKLYYRTSPDMAQWSAPQRLLADLHSGPTERLIDAALAWTDHGLILGYKFGLKDGAQHFEVAWSPSDSLDGPWQIVGRPNITVYGDTIENYQFQRVDGRWNLLGTSNNLDRPWLFTLKGDPSDPRGWLDWSAGRELEVPAERWNSAPGANSITHEQSNGAYLCNARRLDGHFYLFYFGANELTTFGGWGHTSLGVARSTDLIHWEVPCGPGLVSTALACAPATH
jgi:hypothetical protein